MSILEARAALRETVKRLREALAKDTDMVTVRRRDLDVLMATFVEKKLDGKMPKLHPEQR